MMTLEGKAGKLDAVHTRNEDPPITPNKADVPQTQPASTLTTQTVELLQFNSAWPQITSHEVK